MRNRDYIDVQMLRFELMFVLIKMGGKYILCVCIGHD